MTRKELRERKGQIFESCREFENAMELDGIFLLALYKIDKDSRSVLVRIGADREELVHMFTIALNENSELSGILIDALDEYLKPSVKKIMGDAKSVTLNINLED